MHGRQPDLTPPIPHTVLPHVMYHRTTSPQSLFRPYQSSAALSLPPMDTPTSTQSIKVVHHPDILPPMEAKYPSHINEPPISEEVSHMLNISHPPPHQLMHTYSSPISSFPVITTQNEQFDSYTNCNKSNTVEFRGEKSTAQHLSSQGKAIGSTILTSNSVSKHSNTKRALRMPREIVAALTHTIVSENLGTVDEQDSLDNSQSPQAVNLSTCSPAQFLVEDSSAQFTAQDNIAHYLEKKKEKKLSSAQRIARSSNWITLNNECARLAASHSSV